MDCSNQYCRRNWACAWTPDTFLAKDEPRLPGYRRTLSYWFARISSYPRAFPVLSPGDDNVTPARTPVVKSVAKIWIRTTPVAARWCIAERRTRCARRIGEDWAMTDEEDGVAGCEPWHAKVAKTKEVKMRPKEKTKENFVRVVKCIIRFSSRLQDADLTAFTAHFILRRGFGQTSQNRSLLFKLFIKFVLNPLFYIV